MLNHSSHSGFKRVCLRLAISAMAMSVCQAVYAAEPAKPANLEILDDIIVEGRREDAGKLDTETFKTLAGGGNDVLRAIEALPGVTLSGEGFGGDPVIRGSSPIDNQYFVNGVRVGYVFHNDGDSIFNYNLVDNFDLYTGAWSPNRGNAIGGIISVDLSLSDKTLQQREREHITVLDLGFTRTGLMHARKIGDDQRFYFSVRESLLFLYIDALFDEEEGEEEGFSFEQVPRNRDYQLSYAWDINEAISLEFFASGAKDFVGLNITEDSDIAEQDPDLVGDLAVNQAYNNQALILTIDESSYAASWRLNALQEDIELAFGRALDLDGKLFNNSLIVEYDIPFERGFDVQLGLEVLEEVFDYTATGRNQPCNEEFQSCPPGFVAPIITSKDKLKTQMPSVYIDVAWPLVESLELSLGARANFNSYTDKQYLEPRLALEWFIDSDQSAWLRYGQHHQWFKQYEYAYIIDGFGADELDLVEAEHTVLGFGQDSALDFLGDFYWQLEAYYKNLDQLVIANPSAQTDPNFAANANIAPYVNGASGKAWGVEWLLRKSLSERWQGWFTVAYSSTDRLDEITDASFNFEYDQPLIINLVSSYQLSPKVNVSAKWRYQSGRLYTDIIGSEVVNDEAGNLLAYDPVEGEINGKRFSASHRLDIRADLLISKGNPRMGWRKPKILAYVELLNIYGQKNQIGWDYEADYNSREAEYSFPEGILPSFGVSFTF